MKKSISVLLLLVMVLTLLPVQAFAAEYPDTYNVTFQLRDGTVIRRDENVPYTESVVVPSYLEASTWYCQALDLEVATGERIWCDFGTDQEVAFVADSVLPDSFTLNFKLPNGVSVAKNVKLNPENFMDFFTVPTVDGAKVAWNCGKIALTGGQLISGQDLDLEYVWYEKNPVLNFTLSTKPVYPDSFTVKFVDDNDQVVSETVTDFWTFYSAIEIPEGNWMCYRTRQLVSSGDYISGDTLDIDFDWYGSNPEVIFYAN